MKRAPRVVTLAPRCTRTPYKSRLYRASILDNTKRARSVSTLGHVSEFTSADLQFCRWRS